ncbi:MAG: hypothetical protein PSV26_06975 [Polaromonas sp.]|uniref:hypothetical protein n=1 Tax=Polaromonas sp. TaxID=1869339 RepID=UPI002488905F|nr:hypothetical protein [Polaromonas sp.]MDI1237209.1 hypothetical protein [Polaromonas sp.]MDO8370384.1 hypothetical protein [Polaromonas sp.]MDO8755809.1 hypothetical protein [Polaromonas sp.]
MKSIQLHKILASIFTCLTLMACADSSITEVKKASISQSDYTFGEIFDNAKGCKTTEWASQEENGRSVVRYTCTVDTPQAMVDFAERDNTNKVKALSKSLDDGWQRTLKNLESRKETVLGAAAQARKYNDAKLSEGHSQLQAAQAKLNEAMASTPQNYIGYGASGYTPQLLATGRERKQLAIDRAQREVGVAQRRIAEATENQNDPGYAHNQFSSQRGQRSAEEYQQMIDGMLSWRDRYYAAIADLEAREMSRAQEFLKTAKGRQLQMKVTFLVRKKSPVDIGSATWSFDGQDAGPVNLIFLGASLLNPKTLEEVLSLARKARLKHEIDSRAATNSFPIACGETIPTGCELKEGKN